MDLFSSGSGKEMPDFTKTIVPPPLLFLGRKSDLFAVEEERISEIIPELWGIANLFPISIEIIGKGHIPGPGGETQAVEERKKEPTQGIEEEKKKERASGTAKIKVQGYEQKKEEGDPGGIPVDPLSPP